MEEQFEIEDNIKQNIIEENFSFSNNSACIQNNISQSNSFGQISIEDTYQNIIPEFISSPNLSNNMVSNNTNENKTFIYNDNSDNKEEYDFQNHSQQKNSYSPCHSQNNNSENNENTICLNNKQFKKIANRYENQLQIKIKRVKQIIKKGQVIRQKKLFYEPINNLYVYNIKISNKFMIFGNIILEDNYLDYESQFCQNIINQYDQYLKLESIEKDNTNQLFSFNLSSTTTNLMKKFKPICQYYEQSNNIHYKHISDLLQKFEIFIEEYDQEWKEIQDKYSKEEINAYKEIYFQDAVKYIKNQSVDKFINFQIFNYNTQEKQFELIKSGHSYSIGSVIGLFADYIENLLKKVNSYLNPVGQQRIDFLIQILEFFVIRKDACQWKDVPIRTIDSIQILSNMETKLFLSDLIPKDLLNVMKYQAIIQNFDIDAFEIQKIILQRGNELDEIYASLSGEPVHIENTIMTELFLEKFYPDQFQKLLNKNESSIS